MVDFLMISTRVKKRGVVEVYPKFIIKKSNDLMIRGGDFYAIWLADEGRWSTDEDDVTRLVDRELDLYVEKNNSIFNPEDKIKTLHMWDSDSGVMDLWHKYCQRHMRDSFHMLDEKIIFANSKMNKRDYASKKLSYSLDETCVIDGYNELMDKLYSPEERLKIEWAIGAIVTGDSKKIQKFMVLYGAAGTGKSTILNIIQMLFEGYYSVFDAKALGSTNNAFSLEPFKDNPLIGIQHDSDLSRIEDNTRINSLVSHEMMTVNEKFKKSYSNRFKCFLLMGTNKPVRITDAKSGLIRRLIDVSPTGEKLPIQEYRKAMNKIKFELGGIAYHCKNVYLDNIHKYDDYKPIAMLGASNDFYNFVMDSYSIFNTHEVVTLKMAWETYKVYCEEVRMLYPFPQRTFKEELKNYFREYKERHTLDDGTRTRNCYLGFISDKFDFEEDFPEPENAKRLICLVKQKSLLDEILKDCPAQYTTNAETPKEKWINVKTTIKDVDTSKLHYVQPPENHIVIDFDIKDSLGNKNLELNLKEAEKWPVTYSEVSKGGQGLHLHYIYSGDVSKLSRVYDTDIEIKIFTGNSSLRRKLSLCNDIPLSKISSGLPMKEDKKLINKKTLDNEKSLRAMIKRNLIKEFHSGTKPSIDFIYKILEDAYDNGFPYDVSEMYPDILAFASNSTHQAEYCIAKVASMKMTSKKESDVSLENRPIVFFDVEVFSNLLVICWKRHGRENPILSMVNPTPSEVEKLLEFNLVGFNCRRYDNHIVYAALLGYDNKRLYELSGRIIGGDRNAFFREAYNLSYTDVYDFSSKKQSLKKFEIELGITHKELGIPWDKPAPKNRWEEIVGYCCNDVLATEATFDARDSDFVARKILADIAKGTYNDKTNTLTTKIIFGNNKNPQSQFNYRNLGDTNQKLYTITSVENIDETYSKVNEKGQPVFPGYKFEAGKSYYRGEIVSEGGYIHAEPGTYENVALLDIVSMHPTSAVLEELFGPVYTKVYSDILNARVAIKNKDFESAKKMLNGLLTPYLKDTSKAKDLAFALKIAINSVYGLTMTSFTNPFRDPRNIDNIVAKRGALFMINLKHEVQKRGFIVAHIKTDSIKIPNATPEIIQFVRDYGRAYGYEFEHEETYKKMCLVNDSVYIAKQSDDKWNAVGKQFAVPYVYKKLFSKEPIEFKDICETRSTSTALYLGDENKQRFVGKVGRFCPVKDGYGGAHLYQEKEGKYNAVSGTKGYKWLEAEDINEKDIDKIVDLSYYDEAVTEAIKTINKYGDFEKLVA